MRPTVSKRRLDMEKRKGFDLVTHPRDKYGKIENVNPYRLHIIRGVKAFERPVNSGNLWYENGEPAGKLVKKTDPETGNELLSFDHKAPHTEFTPPPSAGEALYSALEQEKARTEALEAELRAMRAEKEAAAAVTPKKETK